MMRSYNVTMAEKLPFSNHSSTIYGMYVPVYEETFFA